MAFSDPKTIILPSFLRKTMKAYALKAHIRNLGCELNRIGRSRNWKLTANREQIYNIIEFVDNADEPSWLWLGKFLNKQQADITQDELLQFAMKHKDITVNQLMARTDCTAAQARRVIDELEFMD